MSTSRFCLSGLFAIVSVLGCSSAQGPDEADPEAEDIGVSQAAICGTSTDLT